jgi:hypothetical protein
VAHPIYEHSCFYLNNVTLLTASTFSCKGSQVKGSGLHGLLLFAGQSGEAVGKCVGYAEVHHVSGQK